MVCGKETMVIPGDMAAFGAVALQPSCTLVG